MSDNRSSQYEIIEEKNIRQSYIYIKNLNINTESYETKIIFEENIDNVIKPQMIFEDEARVLKFDIGNTISLEEYLKNYKLCKADICDIIENIDDILSSVENYLISENSVMLDLKMVRVCKSKNNKICLKFIVIPNYNSDFSYELSKFLIKILRFVNAEDKDALTLAYSLFIRSSKENYTINDLMELIDNSRERNRDFIKDIEALNEYDEKMINEIIMDNDSFNDTFISDEEIDKIEDKKNNANMNMKENAISKEFEIDKFSVNMDENTKKVLANDFFDKFDEGNEIDEKVIKKSIKTKKQKMLKGHISLMFYKKLMVPVVCIIVPLLYYFYYGRNQFAKAIPSFVLFEIIFITSIVIKNIIKDNKKS